MSTMEKIRIHYLLYFLVALLGITSCSMHKKSVPGSPIVTQINIDYDDLEYLGEISGEATQTYFLGLPFGGEKYKIGAIIIPGKVKLPVLRNRGFNNALYYALMSKPDADFILPLAIEVKRDQMFLGKEETIIIKAKAFRLKTN